VSQTEAVPATGALSLTAFAAQHQLELTRFAYLLGGDRQRAEDIVQDVLTALFRRFGDALPVSNPLAYVRAAVVNAQISHGGRRSSSERPLDRHRP
jgi:DNA-directed RNA polymerase specialized sigma24 family protein